MRRATTDPRICAVIHAKTGVLTASLALALATTAPTQSRQPSTDELSAALAAKILASAVFVSGREVDEALQNSVFPTVTRVFGLRPDDLTDIDVDRERKQVRVTLHDEITRTVRLFGDQGCVLLPRGADRVAFEPEDLHSSLPAADETPWPMGDLPPGKRRPDIDRDKLDEALATVFAPRAHTAAFVVVHRGDIVAERYGAGATESTPLESWSMGKSLTAILFGVLCRRQGGGFDPDAPAPIAEWQVADDDPRRAITIGDLLRMSSGLRFSALSDPKSAWRRGHPDHFYVYSGAVDVFALVRSVPAEHPPNTVGRYRNCDPLLIGSIIEDAVTARGESYLAFPHEALFDRIGIRQLTLEPDCHGNFVSTGFEYGTARDWARLGLLVLQDGVWEGDRLLPDGFVEFVSQPAPAWKNREYGGLFWVNGNRRWDAPPSTFYMAGHGGQYVLIVPTHELVVVRMGHTIGGGPGTAALNRALPAILEAVPVSDRVPQKQRR